ncbi:MAG: aminopeptidase [Lachnospirales bacterium]
MDFKEKLELYAKTAVRVGINLKENQELNISAPIECIDLARALTKEAYRAGAKTVHVEYVDQQIALLRYLEAPDSSFEDEYYSWLVDKSKSLLDRGSARINISAYDPNVFKDVDKERLNSWTKKGNIATQPLSIRMMNNEVQWLVISAPTDAVSTLIFPDVDVEKAKELHWEAIFDACRINTKDPVKAWQDHKTLVRSKVKWLNEEDFASLQFTNSDKTTDLNIGLVTDHLWAGVGDTTLDGHEFIPNLPTEEVFSMPDKNNVNGVIRSTKPLNYHGTTIDNFTLTFKDGAVVDYSAEVGYETLKNLLESDEGAKRIGEVALVPDDSPISKSGLTFFTTLYDENASCHLAFGRSYTCNIKGGTTMSQEELSSKGANTSIVHVDFMVGSADLNITGIKKDGTKIPVFVNGNWC